ncbi:phage protein [Photobacterium sp. OFAV2-7]|uniref:phage protein n=1 Tax=Photobacterium sp. OFAV2-7 TaxID=2917748 RepID=UPI001EF3D889|nr:phage protein [Photobacterium sp. OFAV2-7]MCG7585669.1 DUF2597 family protein [Photobacterium sp. OFAV2-7]
MARLSGKNMHFTLGDYRLKANKVTLSITDNSAVNKTSGIPDDYVDGDVEASGEIELSSNQFRILSKAAKQAGSWRGLDVFDAMFYGKTDKDELKVEAFGCRLKVSDLIDIDSNGGSTLVHKLPFDVTSPDFVRIDGVPYLRPEEIEDL